MQVKDARGTLRLSNNEMTNAIKEKFRFCGRTFIHPHISSCTFFIALRTASWL